MKAQHEGALPPPCIVRKDPRCHINTFLPQSAPGFSEGSHSLSRPRATLSPPSTASLTLPQTNRPFAEPSHSPHLLPPSPGWSCSMTSDGCVRVLDLLGLALKDCIQPGAGGRTHPGEATLSRRDQKSTPASCSP